MKIKLLRNPAESHGCELKEGETGQVHDELGLRLVQLGIAVSLEEPKAAPPQVGQAKAAKTLKAVPPLPAAKTAPPADEKPAVDNPADSTEAK